MPPRRSNSTIHLSTRVKHAQNQHQEADVLDDDMYDGGSANAGHSVLSNKKVTAGRWTQEEKDRFNEAI